VCGAPVGEDDRLGICVGAFVSGTFASRILNVKGVGAYVSVSNISAESAEKLAISQGVFGKQARPGGH